MEYVEVLYAVGTHPMSRLIQLTGPFSHGAIYDRERGVAIEAKGSLSALVKSKLFGQKHLEDNYNRVVETPIDEFLKRYKRVELRLMAVKSHQKAMDGYRKKAQKNTKYDHRQVAGFLFGLARKLNRIDRYSCIEFILSEMEYCGQPWEVHPTAAYRFSIPGGNMAVGSLK